VVKERRPKQEATITDSLKSVWTPFWTAHNTKVKWT
jgi:hypothetical protein